MWSVTDLSPQVQYALIVNRRLMRLPIDPECERCGYDQIIALIPPRHAKDGTPLGPVLCLECIYEGEGSSRIHKHDLGGRPSPLARVAVRANLHEQLTQLQNCYWRNRHRPGSMYAVGFDVGALFALRLLVDADYA